MQRTRRALLDYLQRQPGATVDDLATAVGIAPITARAHLAVLAEGGLIEAEEQRHGRGRPVRQYRLTAAAESHFPRHYDRLATELLESLAALQGPPAVQALVRHVAQGKAAAYRPMVEGKPLPERVAAIAAMIDEQGGVAAWEHTGGAFVVHERNCPYLSVSRCSDHVCEIDRQVVAELAGAPVTVASRLRDGADQCDFVIADPESAADQQEPPA
jgi:predicted ArsR family transcriptional regulator